eukprot:XP_019081595.1 PREDICTED: uncharacterized protein LOC100259687 isoform X3 [Vitis vinifera]
MAICLFPIFEQNKRLALCDYNNKYGSTMEESSKLNGIQHRFISYFSMLWSIIKRGRNGCLDISSFVEDEALERSVDQRRSTLYHRRPVRHTNKGIHKGCRNMEERNHNEKEVAKRLGTNGNGTKEVEYKPLPSGLSNGTQNATRKFEELEIAKVSSFLTLFGKDLNQQNNYILILKDIIFQNNKCSQNPLVSKED